MRSQALRFIILGQACFYGGLLIAVLLKPRGLSANNGISYYGIYAVTFIPFAISLIGSAICSWLCATHITEDKLKPIKYTLFAIALFTLAVCVTPYSYDGATDTTHQLAGTILFTLQLLFSFWLLAKLRYAGLALLLSTVELIAGIACAIYLNPVHGFEMQSQIMFQSAFGILLIYGLMQLLPKHAAKERVA